MAVEMSGSYQNMYSFFPRETENKRPRRTLGDTSFLSYNTRSLTLFIRVRLGMSHSEPDVAFHLSIDSPNPEMKQLIAVQEACQVPNIQGGRRSPSNSPSTKAARLTFSLLSVFRALRHLRRTKGLRFKKILPCKGSSLIRLAFQFCPVTDWTYCIRLF